jgi:hypothetical protein
MRAVEGSLGRSLQYWERERDGGLAIPCARATRGRGLPSLDARTMGKHQAAPLILKGEGKGKEADGRARCHGTEQH